MLPHRVLQQVTLSQHYCYLAQAHSSLRELLGQEVATKGDLAPRCWRKFSSLKLYCSNSLCKRHPQIYLTTRENVCVCKHRGIHSISISTIMLFSPKAFPVVIT